MFELEVEGDRERNGDGSEGGMGMELGMGMGMGLGMGIGGPPPSPGTARGVRKRHDDALRFAASAASAQGSLFREVLPEPTKIGAQSSNRKIAWMNILPPEARTLRTLNLNPKS